MKEFLKKDTTFLCVDDDPVSLRVLVNTIKELGFTGLIFEAKDGLHALEIVRENLGDIDFDFVVSDMVMPEMNGIELLKELRKIPEFYYTPIVMLTSKNSRDVVLECINNGASNYIVKPLQKDLLAKKIVETWHKT